MNTTAISDVVRSGFCLGCGLCESIAAPGKVRVELSDEGFLRPRVFSDLDSRETALFRSTCPGVALSHNEPAKGAQVHPIWGPLISVETGYATSVIFRRQGSSGGVLSAIAAYLLESGQVDSVVQIAADISGPIDNSVQISRTSDDVSLAAGSRYGPAAPLRNITDHLNSGERFAFVGKPCDVAALRALARHDSRVSRQVPFVLSFMCAGVPSRTGSVELLRRMGVEVDELTAFRYRGNGWPGMARAETRTGRVTELDYSTSWGEVLNRHLQFRCKICPDGSGEFADIVCADAWYGKDGYPDFSERDGRSLVLARTPVGRNLLDAAYGHGAIRLEPLNLDDVGRMQPYQVARKQLVLARLIGAGLALRRWPRFRGLRLWRNARSANPIALFRNAVGTFRRGRSEAR